MKMLGVRNHVEMKRKGQSKKSDDEKKDVKVKYISSPMKVKTSASKFRELVQELTGQASNVADMFVEADYTYGTHYHNHGVHNSEPYSTTWLKHDDYSHLHSTRSSSSMEPLIHAQLQYQLLNFDMMKRSL